MPFLPRQGRASSNAPWQPWLCSCSGFAIFLARVMEPLPHSTEHSDHSDHSSRLQSTLQGMVLHAFSSLSELSGHWPPCLGGACMVRVRTAWPPPHSLLQLGGFGSLQPSAAHSLHSESRHGCSSGVGQPSVSFSVSLQRLPTPTAFSWTWRVRKRCGCASRSHADQPDQSPTTQSRPSHAGWSQAFVSKVTSSQASPPLRAAFKIRRMRVCRPTPQETLQEVHSCQSVKRQGTGLRSLPQGMVSCVLPVHGSPPFSGGLRARRLRKAWPVAFTHSLHSAQSESAQCFISSKQS
mmetsp:Transcript_129935/g.315610  ORF Transcript_129935/g.315610 Transcript_129935/m.315610 type:complete len:294 (-) Transcript_129935:340-1221(-)